MAAVEATSVSLPVPVIPNTPLGVAKVLPFPIHSAGDYLAAALLLAAPWALNFESGDRGLAVLYVGLGLAVLAVSLITDYQYSPKRTTAGLAAGSGGLATTGR